LQSASRRDSDINVEVNRAEAAPYGLTVGDVQRAITSGIGGENIAENIEGGRRPMARTRIAAIRARIIRMVPIDME
jgi:Cu/Ag efflux pump CusA